ncbi:BQ5605_C003g01949 [Microbotryum silenes-dioicae]|uniref:BQ5605_C003g01949 protein n=1 Tax=Microbotryum silenes-dioicae TaxID=796604 RepID=A0A2X0MUZ1_9BASI|nr:BQ5605_C003g01949 [Microbotryum silenes-dioicae]
MSSLSRTCLNAARPLMRHSRMAHNVVTRKPAEPHTPPSITPAQAPNRATVWSKTQAARTEAMQGPRFEQTDERFQPRPLAAVELIAEEPIRLIQGRVASCDGGHSQLWIVFTFFWKGCAQPLGFFFCSLALGWILDGGSLGHPKIFINLDKPGPKACNYCGIRFEKDVHAHGHH